MGNESLTVMEALKFARHDFLNNLQLVLMHIDLGQIPDAKKAIRNATEEMRELSMLDSLGLPETAKWISTFGWRYTTFQGRLKCEIKPGIREADDLAVVTYLERVFSDIEKLLDATSEYEAHIDVKASSTDWSINITVSGAMFGKALESVQGDSFFVAEKVSDNLWTFTISGR